MSDFNFEARLERLYAQPPRLSDGSVFVRRVEDRLEREWTLRRGLIVVAGAPARIALRQTLGPSCPALTARPSRGDPLTRA